MLLNARNCLPDRGFGGYWNKLERELICLTNIPNAHYIIL